MHTPSVVTLLLLVSFSALVSAQSGDSCLTAQVPNSNPLPEETTDFYGTCVDGKATDGLVIWKQKGTSFDITCVKNKVASQDQLFVLMRAHNEDICLKNLKDIPDYCQIGRWAGQCKDGRPHGVGIQQRGQVSSSGGRILDYYTYVGQANEGRLTGFGTERIARNCGALGCTGGAESFRGWWQNGSREFECRGGLLGCLTEVQARADKLLKERKEQEASLEAARRRDTHALTVASMYKEVRCEEAQKFLTTLPEREQPSYSHTSCLNERQMRSLSRQRDAQAIYLGAVKFESIGEPLRAKFLYELIVDRFPKGPIALKAADRLAAMTDVAAIESSNRQRADAIERANRDASESAREMMESVSRANRSSAERAYQQCKLEVDACYARNGKNCYRNCDSLLR